MTASSSSAAIVTAIRSFEQTKSNLQNKLQEIAHTSRSVATSVRERAAEFARLAEQLASVRGSADQLLKDFTERVQNLESALSSYRESVLVIDLSKALGEVSSSVSIARDFRTVFLDLVRSFHESLNQLKAIIQDLQSGKEVSDETIRDAARELRNQVSSLRITEELETVRSDAFRPLDIIHEGFSQFISVTDELVSRLSNFAAFLQEIANKASKLSEQSQNTIQLLSQHLHDLRESIDGFFTRISEASSEIESVLTEAEKARLSVEQALGRDVRVVQELVETVKASLVSEMSQLKDLTQKLNDLLTQLEERVRGLEEVPTSLRNIAEQTQSVLSEIREICESVENTWGSIKDSLNNCRGRLSEVSENFSSFLSGLDERVAEIETASQQLTDAANSFVEARAKFNELLKQGVTAIDSIKALIDQLTELRNNLSNSVDNIASFFENYIKGIDESLEAISTLDEQINQYVDTKLIDSFQAQLLSDIDRVLRSAESVGDALKDAIERLEQTATDVAAAAAQLSAELETVAEAADHAAELVCVKIIQDILSPTVGITDLLVLTDMVSRVNSRIDEVVKSVNEVRELANKLEESLRALGTELSDVKSLLYQLDTRAKNMNTTIESLEERLQKVERRVFKKRF